MCVECSDAMPFSEWWCDKQPQKFNQLFLLCVCVCPGVRLQIASLKKTLKTHLTDIDEDYTMDYKDSTSSTTSASTTSDSRIKKNKCKIMKPSTGGKSWFKF